MMTERGFWETIANDPDPFHKLVFADWLETEGCGDSDLAFTLRWCARRGRHPKKEHVYIPDNVELHDMLDQEARGFFGLRGSIADAWVWKRQTGKVIKTRHIIEQKLFRFLPKDIYTDWDGTVSPHDRSEYNPGLQFSIYASFFSLAVAMVLYRDRHHYKKYDPVQGYHIYPDLT